MEALFAHLGLNPIDLLAGFSGGMVAALLSAPSRPTAWGVFSAVIVGSLTAGYLGPVAPSYFGMKSSSGTSFVIGIAGIPISRALLNTMKRIRWMPNGTESKGD